MKVFEFEEAKKLSERIAVRRRLAEEWGKWIGKFSWQYYLTLTTAIPTTERAIQRHFATCIRRLEKSAQGRVCWFYVVENTGMNGNVHIHALISSEHNDVKQHIRSAWRLGIVDIERYDSARGASYYIAKTIGVHEDNYAISKHLPPRLMAT